MSSPQERQVGRSTAELATNPRSTRPFSASDDGDLLTVLVHFGRQLDALVPKDSSIETDLVGAAGEQLNTYVVASVGAFAASPDAVQCRRGGDVEAAELPATAHSYPEGRVLYEQKCSPYAATRVVEGSDSSSWNEMLAVPLPIGWSKIPPLKQQRPDLENAAEAKVAPADTEASTHPALKLEIVERGVSHQEDFLLATCVLPLAKTRCELQQARFALVFPSGGTEGTPEALCACLYVSLYTTPSQISSSSGALQQVEIVVECFTPVVVTGSEVEGLPLDCTSLAALVHLHTDTGTKFDEPTEKLGEIEHHFTPLHHNQVLPQPSNTIAVNGIGTGVKLVGVSPSSSPATGSVSGVYEWFFPFSFALLTGSSQDTSVAAVDIELFRTSAFPHNRVGRGRLELSSAVAQGVKTDGSPLRQTVIPITLDGDSSYILGHIALRLRWWDAVAWRAFVDGIPSRRVVCTKRWKRSPRPTIAWMGALLRGLNRHPVASICDAGGVSSVLAELIAQPSSSGEDKQNLPHDHDHQQQHQNLAVQLNHKESDDTFVLLRGQLTHLQAEGAAQRQQIARLQGELDTRLAAIKTCGLEIVALRREARQKDEQLQKLKEQAEAAQRREQQQLTELLASTSTNGGALGEMSLDVYTYTNVINAHCKVGNVKDAKRLLRVMEEKGCSPNLVTYNVVIRGLCGTGTVDEALELKESMEAKGLIPDIYTYSTLIDGFCKKKRPREAKVILVEMTDRNLVPSAYTCGVLINALCNSGDLCQAILVLEKMIAAGVRPNAVIYTPIIKGYVEDGKFDEAKEIVHDMWQKGILPDILCYNTIITGLCKVGKIDEAKMCLVEMERRKLRPNSYTFGAFISWCREAGNMQVAEQYFWEMLDRGVAPNYTTFTSIIDGYCKYGNIPQAFSVLNRMLEIGRLPNVQLYGILINALAKNGNLPDARNVLSELYNKGLVPDVFTYTSLISGFCKQGNSEEAFLLLDEMCQKGVRPSIVTYNALIGGLCKSGDLSRAREVFDGISGKGLAPNAVTYSTIIDGYSKAGDLTEAFRLSDEMPSQGVQPDAFVYNALLHGCCRAGETEKALSLFHEMVEKRIASTLTFNTLIDGLCKLGRMSEALELVKGMSDRHPPDHVTFTILIDYCCKNGIMKEAEDLFQQMQERKLIPTIVTYTSLIQGYHRLGDKLKVFSLFEEMVARGIEPDEVVYSSMVDALYREGNLHKAFSLWNELLDKGLLKGHVSETLVQSWCEKGEISALLASLNEIGEQGFVPSIAMCSTLAQGLDKAGYSDKLPMALETMVKFSWISNSMTSTDLITRCQMDGHTESVSNPPKQSAFEVALQA